MPRKKISYTMQNRKYLLQVAPDLQTSVNQPLVIILVGTAQVISSWLKLGSLDEEIRSQK